MTATCRGHRPAWTIGRDRRFAQRGEPVPDDLSAHVRDRSGCRGFEKSPCS